MRAWELASSEDHRRFEGLIADGEKVRKHLESLGITGEKLMVEFEEWRRKRRAKP